MTKEKGHEGAVAPMPKPQTALEILSDIRDLLMQDREVDSASDFTHPRDIVITAAAGSLWLDESTAYGYVYIPNMPRRCTFFTGSRGDLIGTFEAGANVRFKLPRQTGLTIDYAAGSAAQSMTIWFSTRPIEIDGGVVQVSPAGTGGVSGLYQEDTPHVSGDWGRQAIGVVNVSMAQLATDGRYGPLGLNPNGAAMVAISGGGIPDAFSSGASSLRDFSGSNRLLAGMSYLFNGSTADRPRNNQDLTILASAARTVTTDSVDFTNYNGRGLDLWFDITAVPGVTTVTLSVVVKDPVSGLYSTIFTAAAEVGIATRHYRIYPGETVVANVAASVALARTFRVRVTHSGAGSFTYSVGGSIIL